MMNYTTDILNAQFDENGLAVVPGWAKIYRCHPNTREYIGAAMDNVPYGGSVVADAYLDEPEIPTVKNMAIVRSPDGKSWLHVPDYRGSVAYDKETKQQTEITDLGELPDNLTLDAPKTPFDKWNGKKWVTDKTELQAYEVAVAESQKQSLLAEAEQEIAMLERKVRLNMATETDRVKLTEWEIYSVKVTDTDTSAGAGTEWPTPPASPAR
ncbi:tail fiber assembly protein [Morganella morganii]|uniref:tail fiber assembly protein n=1 Tax=Morganella morganii TaxID=582 RepID=UPI00298E157D|nr:tail fiber assembly protein [Morganella morganii]MDW7789905.1 tail fiber assembly protein [Morganella morganii]